MPCYHVGNGIVCMRRPLKPAPRCACGKSATRECDGRLLRFVGPRGGKLTRPRQVTCDEPLCDDCTHEPAEGKDLCPAHAAKWRERQEGGARQPEGPVLSTETAEASPSQRELFG